MGTVRISLTLPPNIDPARATLAYGNWAPARLKRELEDDALKTRQLAVFALSEYLHDPENIASMLHVGVISSLRQLLQDADETCRKLAADCVATMNTHAIGRHGCVTGGLLEPLEELLLDEDEECRLTAHRAINRLCESVEGCLAVIDTKALLPTLTKLVDEDIDSAKILALESISNILMADVGPAHEQILDDDILVVLRDLLEHYKPLLRLRALECLTSITFCRKAKEMVDKSHKRVIPVLIEFLNSTDAKCRAKACLCLANVCMFAKGKKWGVNYNILQNLVPLAFDGVSEVRTNALAAITRISELPVGRQEALNHVDRLRRLTRDPVPIVRKQAEICVKVITWKP